MDTCLLAASQEISIDIRIRAAHVCMAAESSERVRGRIRGLACVSAVLRKIACCKDLWCDAFLPQPPDCLPFCRSVEVPAEILLLRSRPIRQAQADATVKMEVVYVAGFAIERCLVEDAIVLPEQLHKTDPPLAEIAVMMADLAVSSGTSGCVLHAWRAWKGGVPVWVHGMLVRSSTGLHSAVCVVTTSSTLETHRAILHHFAAHRRFLSEGGTVTALDVDEISRLFSTTEEANQVGAVPDAPLTALRATARGSFGDSAPLVGHPTGSHSWELPQLPWQCSNTQHRGAIPGLRRADIAEMASAEAAELFLSSSSSSCDRASAGTISPIRRVARMLLSSDDGAGASGLCPACPSRPQLQALLRCVETGSCFACAVAAACAPPHGGGAGSPPAASLRTLSPTSPSAPVPTAPASGVVPAPSVFTEPVTLPLLADPLLPHLWLPDSMLGPGVPELLRELRDARTRVSFGLTPFGEDASVRPVVDAAAASAEAVSTETRGISSKPCTRAYLGAMEFTAAADAPETGSVDGVAGAVTKGQASRHMYLLHFVAPVPRGAVETTAPTPILGTETGTSAAPPLVLPDARDGSDVGIIRAGGNTAAADPAAYCAGLKPQGIPLPFWLRLADGLPPLDVDARALLTRVQPWNIILVLNALLLEKCVFVLSEDPTVLSDCMQALAGLLQPFEWVTTYAPVLPPSFYAQAALQIEHSPLPFMLGGNPDKLLAALAASAAEDRAGDAGSAAAVGGSPVSPADGRRAANVSGGYTLAPPPQAPPATMERWSETGKSAIVARYASALTLRPDMVILDIDHNVIAVGPAALPPEGRLPHSATQVLLQALLLFGNQWAWSNPGAWLPAEGPHSSLVAPPAQAGSGNIAKQLERLRRAGAKLRVWPAGPLPVDHPSLPVKAAGRGAASTAPAAAGALGTVAGSRAVSNAEPTNSSTDAATKTRAVATPPIAFPLHRLLPPQTLMLDSLFVHGRPLSAAGAAAWMQGLQPGFIPAGMAEAAGADGPRDRRQDFTIRSVAASLSRPVAPSTLSTLLDELAGGLAAMGAVPGIPTEAPPRPGAREGTEPEYTGVPGLLDVMPITVVPPWQAWRYDLAREQERAAAAGACGGRVNTGATDSTDGRPPRYVCVHPLTGRSVLAPCPPVHLARLRMAVLEVFADQFRAVRLYVTERAAAEGAADPGTRAGPAGAAAGAGVEGPSAADPDVPTRRVDLDAVGFVTQEVADDWLPLAQRMIATVAFSTFAGERFHAQHVQDAFDVLCLRKMAHTLAEQHFYRCSGAEGWLWIAAIIDAAGIAPAAFAGGKASAASAAPTATLRSPPPALAGLAFKRSTRVYAELKPEDRVILLYNRPSDEALANVRETDLQSARLASAGRSPPPGRGPSGGALPERQLLGKLKLSKELTGLHLPAAASVPADYRSADFPCLFAVDNAVPLQDSSVARVGGGLLGALRSAFAGEAAKEGSPINLVFGSANAPQRRNWLLHLRSRMRGGARAGARYEGGLLQLLAGAGSAELQVRDVQRLQAAAAAAFASAGLAVRPEAWGATGAGASSTSGMVARVS